MKKTIYFYNCFITHNSDRTNIHISELLDEIIVLNPSERLKGNICLMGMTDPNANRDYQDRKVVFGKFRENKPFLGNIGTDRIDEIRDDVLELTSVFYRRNSRLLIIEYNHHGPRPNAIQNYLSSFLPNTPNDLWTVQLEPVEPQLSFQDIERSNDIRRVEFVVDLTAKNRRLYSSEDNTSVLGDILSKSIETHYDFGANIAYIGFGNGRKRSRVIDSTNLVNLLRGLYLDGEVFQSVRVKYKSPTTGKVEELDIKNEGVLKDVIDIDISGWRAVCDLLEEYFYTNRLGADAYRDYEYIPDRLPELLIFNNQT